MAGLIEIMEKSGGAKGFANQVFKLASTVYHASILTLTIAFAFFFDDFASEYGRVHVTMVTLFLGRGSSILRRDGGSYRDY